MKILWIRLSSLGDVVHTLPALRQLISLGHQVDFLIETNYVDILSQIQGINKIILVNLRDLKKSPWQLIKNIYRVRAQIKSENYDAIIDAQGLYKSAILAFKCSRVLIGGNKYSVRERGISAIYSHKVNINLSANVLDRYFELTYNALKVLRMLPAVASDQKPIKFGFTKNFVKNPNNPKKIYFLHGISNFRRNKQLPLTTWSDLAKICIAEGYQVYTIWQSSDEKTFAEFLSNQGVIVIPPKTISELIDIFTDNTQITAAITLDSGLGHLINGLEIPNIMLFGPTSARRFNTAHKDYQKYLDVKYDCAPCGLRSCKHLTSEQIKQNAFPPCWNSISATSIFNLLQDIV